jgi:hypothetical protein
MCLNLSFGNKLKKLTLFNNSRYDQGIDKVFNQVLKLRYYKYYAISIYASVFTTTKGMPLAWKARAAATKLHERKLRRFAEPLPRSVREIGWRCAERCIGIAWSPHSGAGGRKVQINGLELFAQS